MPRSNRSDKSSYSKSNKNTQRSNSQKYDNHGRHPQRKYEEYAWSLAYLPEGSPTDPQPFREREPVVQSIGESWFTLLELIPRKGVSIEPITRLGIGKDNRDVIHKIKRRIGYSDLSPTSEKNLEDCITKIIEENEFRFVNWFNKASLVTSRMHSFKLLPGIGTTHLENLLDERNKVQFTSFEDIENRTKVSDAKKLIVGRVLKELTNPDEKYRLFTRRP
ncbi:MAG: DUF655 domain-containing protein [Asgard group archaeon]|nr:DUF655 domain-containing protein [Asgard group archaeon]